MLVRVQSPEPGQTREIVGFENHGGRTYLGEDVKPLGEVVVGYGNNGKDGTEGARRLNAYGTYLHGSLLPKNPWLTDQLILNALRRVDESFELEPLDDTVEGRAFSSVAGRVAGRRQRHRIARKPSRGGSRTALATNGLGNSPPRAAGPTPESRRFYLARGVASRFRR